MKGYGLLVGVNQTKFAHYKKNAILNCAKTDVMEMQSLLNRIPYFRDNITSFTDEKATLNSVTDSIKELNKVKEDAYLVIFFSGHGASIPKELHRMGNETIGYYCFYEEMISEYEIRDVLKTINPNFKVFVISDSCHSGEIGDDLVRTAELFAFLNKNITDKDLPQLKSISQTFMESVFTDKANNTNYINKLNKYYNDLFSPNAEVAIMSACKRDQVTETNHCDGMPSAFTRTLITSWSKNIAFGHSNFRDLLATKRLSSQEPQLKSFGKISTDFFSNTRPFAVDAITTGIEDLSFDDFEENEGLTVKLKRLPDGSSGYKYKNSNSYLIDEPMHDVLSIKGKLTGMGCDLRNIGVLGIVYVSENAVDQFPHEIDSLIIDSAIGVDSFVVVINESNGQILHKGRTKGKVSNTIGGLLAL